MFGNWTHESYRTEIEDEIITAFTFPPIDNKNKEETNKEKDNKQNILYLFIII